MKQRLLAKDDFDAGDVGVVLADGVHGIDSPAAADATSPIIYVRATTDVDAESHGEFTDTSDPNLIPTVF